MSEVETPAPKKRAGVRTLHSADDVRRLMARIIKSRLSNDAGIDDSCLRALSGACSVLLKSIEQADLDGKLAEITRRLDEFEARKL